MSSYTKTDKEYWIKVGHERQLRIWGIIKKPPIYSTEWLEHLNKYGELKYR